MKYESDETQFGMEETYYRGYDGDIFLEGNREDACFDCVKRVPYTQEITYKMSEQNTHIKRN